MAFDQTYCMDILTAATRPDSDADEFVYAFLDSYGFPKADLPPGLGAKVTRTPLLTQPVGDRGDHAGQALRLLPGGASPVITVGLGFLGIVATRGDVTAQFMADRTALDAKLSTLA